MASEKKMRRMGAGEKIAHKPKTKPCPTCTGKLTWARVGGGSSIQGKPPGRSKMVWWCEFCAAFDPFAELEGRGLVT